VQAKNPILVKFQTEGTLRNRLILATPAMDEQ
jgi:hypothetical protein